MLVKFHVFDIKKTPHLSKNLWILFTSQMELTSIGFISFGLYIGKAPSNVNGKVCCSSMC